MTSSQAPDTDACSWRPLVLLGRIKRRTKDFSVVGCNRQARVCANIEEALREQEKLTCEQPSTTQFWRVSPDDDNLCEFKLDDRVFGKLDKAQVEHLQSRHWKIRGSQIFTDVVTKEGLGHSKKSLEEILLPKPAAKARIQFANGDPWDFRLANLSWILPSSDAFGGLQAAFGTKGKRKQTETDSDNSSPEHQLPVPNLDAASTASASFVAEDGRLKLPLAVFTEWKAYHNVHDLAALLSAASADMDPLKLTPTPLARLVSDYRAVVEASDSLLKQTSPTGFRLLNTFMLRVMLQGNSKSCSSFVAGWKNEYWRLRFWARFCKHVLVRDDITNDTILRAYTRNFPRVYNFPPTVAKAIYNKFVPPGGATLDPCAGYGGRVCGFWASKTAARYVGYDPNSLLRVPHSELLSFLRTVDPLVRKTAEILPFPAEEMTTENGEEFDLMFTSPPYFDTEHYVSEPTQSSIRFPTYQAWLEGFLFVMLRKGTERVKKNGHVAINIRSVRNNDMVEDTRRYLREQLGLLEQEPIPLQQPRLPMKVTSRSTREFIYVFRKKAEI